MASKYRFLLTLISLNLLICSPVFGKSASEEISLRKKTIIVYTPHIFNPKNFSFELGFVTRKKIPTWDYMFNAFAKATISEEFFSTASDLRAGALGVKTGVFLPTQPWIPLLFEMAIGYAKTSLHKEPWLGDRDDSVADKELFLFEAGGIYRISNTLFIRMVYQINNLDYFKRTSFFSVGFNF